MNLTALIIIIVVFGVVIGNIMLLKHSAKIPMTRIKQDPIEKAEEILKARKAQQESVKQEKE